MNYGPMSIGEIPDPVGKIILKGSGAMWYVIVDYMPERGQMLIVELYTTQLAVTLSNDVQVIQTGLPGYYYLDEAETAAWLDDARLKTRYKWVLEEYKKIKSSGSGG